MDIQNKTAISNVLCRDIETNSERYDEIERSQISLQQRINQLLLWFAELARTYRIVVVKENDIAIPSEVEGHRFLYRFYKPSEYVSYLASILLLFFLIKTSLAISILMTAILTGIIILVFAFFFAGTLVAFSKVKPEIPGSIKKVYYTLAVGGFLAIAGLVIFALTRGSSEEEGLIAFAYLAAGPLAEIGFAISAACFRILSSFYSWSLTAARDFQTMQPEYIELSQEKARLFGVLVTDYDKLLKQGEYRSLNISLERMKKLRDAVTELNQARTLPSETEKNTVITDPKKLLTKEKQDDEKE